MKPFVLMNKLVQKNSDLFFVFILFVTAKIYFYLILLFSKSTLPVNPTYLAQSRLANFDGVHYLSIAENGYGYAQQAFFPLFPILIKLMHQITGVSYLSAGIILSNIILLLLLLVFYKWIKKLFDTNISKWTAILFVSSPMAFFLQCLYTESLFLLLVALSFLLAGNKKYFLALFVAGIASGTRVVGVFLLPTIIIPYIYSQKSTINLKFVTKSVLYCALGVSGIAGYVWYLFVKYNDPLLFLHTQSAFGANRSNGELILLPQVLFRYLKILLTVDPSTLTFWISVSELVFLFLAIGICFAAFKTKIPKQYTIFSLILIIFPTLTGTLSSIPRYTLAAIVIPVVFALSIKNTKNKVFLVVCMFLFQFVFASLFFAGFFVS